MLFVQKQYFFLHPAFYYFKPAIFELKYFKEVNTLFNTETYLFNCPK